MPPDAQSRTGHALRVENLSISFRGLRALNDVSFTIGASANVGILGPNGAGKTTLVNCVSGIYKPTAGEIHFGQDRIDGISPARVTAKGIVRTFQTVEQFSTVTVLDLVLAGRHQQFSEGAFRAAFSMPSYRRAEKRERNIALGYLTRFDLADLAQTQIGRVPYGARKLVDLARALATEPTLLVLDEPAAGVSRTEKAALLEILRASSGTYFSSLVVIEHDIDFVRQLCDRVVVLDFGEKIGEGALQEVLTDRKVREAYFGPS
jgi:ABC-type branched-subunit amino acid transport system ATPase component